MKTSYQTCLWWTSSVGWQPENQLWATRSTYKTIMKLPLHRIRVSRTILRHLSGLPAFRICCIHKSITVVVTIAQLSQTVAPEAFQKWGGTNSPENFFTVPPHFFVVPPWQGTIGKCRAQQQELSLDRDGRPYEAKAIFDFLRSRCVKDDLASR